MSIDVFCVWIHVEVCCFSFTDVVLKLIPVNRFIDFVWWFLWRKIFRFILKVKLLWSLLLGGMWLLKIIDGFEMSMRSRSQILWDNSPYFASHANPCISYNSLVHLLAVMLALASSSPQLMSGMLSCPAMNIIGVFVCVLYSHIIFVFSLLSSHWFQCVFYHQSRTPFIFCCCSPFFFL